MVSPEIEKACVLLLKTYDKIQKVTDELRGMDFGEEMLDCLGVPKDSDSYSRDWCYDVLVDDKISGEQKIKELFEEGIRARKQKSQ